VTRQSTSEAPGLFVVEFDHRSDNGDRVIGPFASREAAEKAVSDLGIAVMSVEGAQWDAEYQIFELAAVIADAEALDDDEIPLDELEEGEEEITEIPVHGVATLEGKPTGDGRGFRPGGLSFGKLPAPLGYEYVSTHGGMTSDVAIVGRIDEFWTVPAPHEGEDVYEVRWRGVIMPGKEYGARAIESIVDGSYTGLSVIVDSVTVDVEERREEMRQNILREQAADSSLSDIAEDEVAKKREPMTEEEIEELVDAFVGDGKQEVTWYKEARIRRFDMVPTGAFQEGYTALGAEFPDELGEEALVAAAAALEDCGCGRVHSIRADAGTIIVDLTEFTEDELEEYDALAGDEQDEYARVHGAIIASAFAPGTKDGPGWITHPTATARLRRYWVRGKGAAKIRWGAPGDFNRCRMQLAKYVQNPDWLAGLCANMHKEAIGVWPGQEGTGGRHSLVASATPAPIFALTAAAEPVDAALFQRVDLEEPVGVEIDGEHFYGYVALWNVCHIGEPEGRGSCTYAPRSATGYAHFRTGTVMTTEGRVAVGSITMNTGHANGRISAAAAAAHYDNTGTVIADVAVGEDHFGIWYSGRKRPGVSDDDIYAAMASGRISGDWRMIGGNYELVGALVVNVAGYPMAQHASLVASADFGITAIIGEGIVPVEQAAIAASAEIASEPLALTAELVADIAITAAERALFGYKRDLMLAELAPAREALRAHSLRQARARLALMTKGS
jgi:hypothetical protein